MQKKIIIKEQFGITLKIITNEEIIIILKHFIKNIYRTLYFTNWQSEHTKNVGRSEME